MQLPFQMTREQLASLPPVGLPRPEPRGESRQQIEHRLRTQREIAAVGGNNLFMAYVQQRQAQAIQTMIVAANDDDRRNAQAQARAWTEIHKQIVTAAEQCRTLEAKLKTV